MSWQATVLIGLGAVIACGFAWYERSRPPARLVALVAALAALAVAGRLVLAPIPNVVGTTDVALISGYALGAAPGFAVGALAAPVSNIWLGQGPWTVWQMGGWGMVGLAGAGLAALAGRRLGRWGLAAACGVAGLAYGALLDLHVMVTYGGEQSLDRYLALSARAIPFNVAHVAGNVVIALVAGPALARMIARYRTRLEFRWRPAPALPAVAAALAVATSMLGEAGTARAGVGTADSVAWIARAQNTDGGFGAGPGYPSSPAMTGWVMLGLEAAGRNPLDVRNGGQHAVAYLRSEVGRLRSAGDLERTILALEGAGRSARDFAGRDLVRELRRRRSADGSVSSQVNLTAFYVLAMRAAGGEASRLAGPVRWLRQTQNPDGGWGFQPDAPSDPDSTGAALQALAAGPPAGRASAEGVGWLRRAQAGDGGFALATSGLMNAQSTAWAAQGLLAAGGGGTTLRQALGFLDRLRAADGHYRYSRSSDQTPLWVTAQALLAVERKAFPLAAVGSGATAPVASGDSDGEADGARSTEVAPGAGRDDHVGGVAGQGARASTPKAAAGDRQEIGSGLGRARTPEETDSKSGEGNPKHRDRRSVVLADGGLLPGEAALNEPAEDDSSSAPYVAGGLGALAVALGAGFLWYRRRLP